MRTTPLGGTIVLIARERKESRESAVALSRRHRPNRCAHRRDRWGEHPLAAHSRSPLRPERPQARSLASRACPRGRVARALLSNPTLRRRGNSLGGPEVGGAPHLSDRGCPYFISLLPIRPLWADDAAQRADLPRLCCGGGAGGGALSPGGRAHPRAPERRHPGYSYPAELTLV